jgi:hypothetical protein
MASLDQLEFSELDGDDTAVLERGAKYVQIFRCEPTADVKDETLFSRKSIDSPRHWLGAPVRTPRAPGWVRFLSPPQHDLGIFI